jgi:hypothetical protein
MDVLATLRDLCGISKNLQWLQCRYPAEVLTQCP